MTGVPQLRIVIRDMERWQSTEGAFVVQFRRDADIPGGRLLGRVEHIATYRAARFQSLDELLAFMASVLTEAKAHDSE
jgi:hypothetical protein